VEAEHILYLAGSEEEADKLENVLADDAFEVLVVDQTLDLAGVIEDEVFLSLPLVPMHDVCGNEYEQIS
jgi:uncharacterized metal-binding protein YceD (DUF177 family)